MRKFGCVVSIILFVFFGCALAACAKPAPPEEPKAYTVEFRAGAGGRIDGKAEQTVSAGDSTENVTAVADTGYYFAGWADIGPCTDETVVSDARIIECVTESRIYYAMFERVTLQVKYIGGENGRVDGEKVQTVKYGDNTESVTAVADIGYRFVEWSDGVKEPTRSESNVTESKELAARFELIEKTYEYNYKHADGGCDEKNVTLVYGRLSETRLATPTRVHSKFDGWFADKYLTERVADADGNILVGDEFFDKDCTRLYAKWAAENTAPYRILIVYVTELVADLHTIDRESKEIVHVDYKMTETERRICEMVTEKISFELNDLAIADFQVDEYYTTETLTEKNMSIRYDSPTRMDNELWAYDISEVREKLPDYDSVIVSFSMDNKENLRFDAGSAEATYANVHFDGQFSQLLLYGGRMEDLLDPLHYYWGHFLNTYLHELAHTIELKVNDMYRFHSVVEEYLWDAVFDSLLAERLYFLNKAVVNGETVGVPFEFWERKVATVHYEATDGGRIVCSKHHNPTIGQDGHDDIQYVLYGDNAISVTAIPNDNYEFVGWSDGVESVTRQDINLIADLHVYAIFKLIE